ncbi:hypothetical protein CEXT_698691 [Caerostris extrusa]|uniref:Uncharacterized protein n=1 Tax=Caerostris extrusa TaxID=172846 RepID=A0AAV4MQP9_CAEEX|nr:hypothetical protein CEXT_698691 [Caerostris extrusa]
MVISREQGISGLGTAFKLTSSKEFALDDHSGKQFLFSSSHRNFFLSSSKGRGRMLLFVRFEYFASLSRLQIDSLKGGDLSEGELLSAERRL